MHARVRIVLLVLVEAVVGCGRRRGSDEERPSVDLLPQLLSRVQEVLVVLRRDRECVVYVADDIRLVHVLFDQRPLKIAGENVFEHGEILVPEFHVCVESDVRVVVCRIHEDVQFEFRAFRYVERILVQSVEEARVVHQFEVLFERVLAFLERVGFPKRDAVVFAELLFWELDEHCSGLVPRYFYVLRPSVDFRVFEGYESVCHFYFRVSESVEEGREGELSVVVAVVLEEKVDAPRVSVAVRACVHEAGRFRVFQKLADCGENALEFRREGVVFAVDVLERDFVLEELLVVV